MWTQGPFWRHTHTLRQRHALARAESASARDERYEICCGIKLALRPTTQRRRRVLELDRRVQSSVEIPASSAPSTTDGRKHECQYGTGRIQCLGEAYRSRRAAAVRASSPLKR